MSCAALAPRPRVSRKGRPKLPDEKRRSEVLRFRVTGAQADALYRAAIRQRIALSDYIRALVLRSEQ